MRTSERLIIEETTPFDNAQVQIEYVDYELRAIIERLSGQVGRERATELVKEVAGEVLNDRPVS